MMLMCNASVAIEYGRRTLGLPNAPVDVEYGNNGTEE